MSEKPKGTHQPGPITRLGVRDLVDEMQTNVQTVTQALGRASVRAHIFERLLHLFSNPGTVEASMDLVLDIAMDAVPCEASSLLVTDPATNELYVVAARGPVAEQARKIRLPIGTGLAGVCVMYKQTLPVSDVSQDPRFEQEFSKSLGFPTKSILVSPILHSGNALGAIELINRKHGNEYQSHEIDLLEKIGRAAGTLLAHIAARSS